MTRVLLSLLCAASLAAADPAVDKCRVLQHHGEQAQARVCFSALEANPDPFLSAEGYFGLGEFDAANQGFITAYKKSLGAEVKTEWGRMFLEHYQPGEAAKLFAEAIETNPNYAPAYLGMARVFAERYDKRAVELAREALKYDPKMAEAHELLGFLALEDGNRKAATEEAQAALSLSNEALDGMAVLASMDWLDNKTQSEWMDRILKINPHYGQAYETGAHFLEINYRYEDAIDFDRKAIAIDENLWKARSELGVNLMRLGHEEEARQQLEKCYAAHWRNPETVNSLRLLDSLSGYQTFKTANTELVLNKKEAPLLRPYMEPELERAVATYERKYKMKLPGPVRLEVYPNHDDFAVRTLGLPGQGGLLGVTFGLVVTMDSPSARPPGDFNWGSTMWHELSHVYVLTATHHKVPRWFTEGLAVHEEGVAAPDWGSRLTPDIVMALQKKQLLPVLDLDRGFVRPQFPGQVLVSYYEAGKICDYITQKWGDDTILGIIHSYAAGKSTAEVIEENLHEKPEAFDKDFGTWLDTQTSTAVHHFDEWKHGIEVANADVKAGKPDDALREVKAVKKFYPDYVGAGSAYEVDAQIYKSKNENPQAMEEMQEYRDHGGTNIEVMKTLARLETDTNNIDQAKLTLKKLTYIYPEDEETHRMLAKLALESGDVNLAVRESQATLALKPADAAETHYELAQALNAAHRLSEAKDQVILALEAAPDFKPAQQLLLQLSR